MSRVHERGSTELATEEAFEELGEAMKRGEIATVAQAHRFLSERGGALRSSGERQSTSETAQGEAEDGLSSAREGRPKRAGGLQKSSPRR